MTFMRSPDYPVLSAHDFLNMEFGKTCAELDEGVIRTLSGHDRRAGQIIDRTSLLLVRKLSGSTFRVAAPSRAVITHELSVRFPDIAVGRDDPNALSSFASYRPSVLVELHNATTARTDLRIKLEEYKALDSVDTIVFVDIASERLRVIQRTGPHGWSDIAHDAPFDVPLPALGLTLPHAEMFARD